MQMKERSSGGERNFKQEEIPIPFQGTLIPVAVNCELIAPPPPNETRKSTEYVEKEEEEVPRVVKSPRDHPPTTPCIIKGAN